MTSQNKQKRNAGILRYAQNDKQEQTKAKYGDSGFARMTTLQGFARMTTH
jgi:hypothetical protein